MVRRARGGKGANAAKTYWNCGESGHMSSQCPAVEEFTTANHAFFQDTIMVGSVGSYVDVGSVSEVTVEPRGAAEKICSMGAPNVREGKSVDIESNSGVEVSCLPVNNGADSSCLPVNNGRFESTARDEAQHVEVTTLWLVAANCMSSAPDLGVGGCKREAML